MQDVKSSQLQKVENKRDKIAEEIDETAMVFNIAKMSARRRMVDKYPKFINIDNWDSLPIDVKKFLFEQ